MGIKRRNKKGKKGDVTVKSQTFADMLRQVNLGGTIQECVLEVKKGKGVIEAVDMTNAIIVSTKAKIMGKDISQKFGLGNLELLIKFLQTIDDTNVQFKTSDLYFTLKRKDGRRKLEYLLTQPDLIATKIYEKDKKGRSVYEVYVGMTTHRAELTSTFIKDYLNYVGMLKTKDTTLRFDEDLTFICGGEDDHQFELVLSSEVEGDDESFENKINGEHFAKVLGTLDFDEDEPPVILFADGTPVVIEESNTIWALVPLYEVQEEEND